LTSRNDDMPGGQASSSERVPPLVHWCHCDPLLLALPPLLLSSALSPLSVSSLLMIVVGQVQSLDRGEDVLVVVAAADCEQPVAEAPHETEGRALRLHRRKALGLLCQLLCEAVGVVELHACLRDAPASDVSLVGLRLGVAAGDDNIAAGAEAGGGIAAAAR
jgi:hypothetical protein